MPRQSPSKLFAALLVPPLGTVFFIALLYMMVGGGTLSVVGGRALVLACIVAFIWIAPFVEVVLLGVALFRIWNGEQLTRYRKTAIALAAIYLAGLVIWYLIWD